MADDTTEIVEYQKYYTYLTQEDDNTSFRIDCPDDTGYYYVIDVRFNQITKQWYCRINEHKGEEITTTSWKRIVNTISLNIEYRNIMSYCIGCDASLPIDPDTQEFFNNQSSCLFLTNWENLEYL